MSTTPLSEELRWRGFANQTTYQDLTALDGEPISFYFGVDPSADSMTVGNLAAAMMVRHFINAGHKAYILVGGATGYIGGDPDGKDESRPLKSIEEVERNKAAIAKQYETVFAGQPFTLVDNYDWFQGISYLDFLRDIGNHVPMSQMLGRDFVQTRLQGNGINYAEFSYSLIQGYDFLHLYRQHDVTLQLCGADQWGNSIAGVDLVRRVAGGQAHVYSTPLVINRATGKKFGKSEGGAIWLDPAKTSPYKFYQFWLNSDDEGVIDYLKFYTLLSREEIEALASQQAENPGVRAAQHRLAAEVTTLIHGADRTAAVERVTAVLFGGAAFSSLNEADLDELAAEIPTVPVNGTVVSALVQSGIASSNGEAMRLIRGGGVSINGKRIAEDRQIESATLIKKGKNTFALAR